MGNKALRAGINKMLYYVRHTYQIHWHGFGKMDAVKVLQEKEGMSFEGGANKAIVAYYLSDTPNPINSTKIPTRARRKVVKD